MGQAYWDKPKTAKDAPQNAGDKYGLPVGVNEHEDPKKAKLVDAILASNYAELDDDFERPGDPDFAYLKKRKRKDPNRKK